MAYTKSARRANLNTPAHDHEDLDRLTTWEERMLEDLRHRYPSLEKRYKQQAKVERTTDQHVDDLNRFFLARKSYREMEDDAMEGFEAILKQVVGMTVDLQMRLDVQIRLNGELHAEIARLKGLPPPTKVIFRPVGQALLEKQRAEAVAAVEPSLTTVKPAEIAPTVVPIAEPEKAPVGEEITEENAPGFTRG